MLPKKIPNYVLFLIWFAGTLPYLVITFWLEDIPAPYWWLEKLGKLLSGFSAAFSTAFPFWYVIEWFTRREKRFEVATVQREFLDRAAREFNNFVRHQGTNWLIADRHKDPPKYLSEKTSKEIIEMLLERLKNHPKLLSLGGDFESYFNWSFTLALEKILNRSAMVDPHLASFSSDFKAQFLALKKDLTFWVAHIPEQNDYGSVWMAIETTHRHFKDMEETYLKDHKIKR